MKAAQIIRQCREEFSDAAEAEAAVSAVLSWLSQEHLARQMLVRLPTVSAVPGLQQLNILFANLYSEFALYVVGKNKSARWSAVHEAVEALPRWPGACAQGVMMSRQSPPRATSRFAVTQAQVQRYVAQMEGCVTQLLTAVLSAIKPDAQTSTSVSSAPLHEQLPEKLALAYAEFDYVLRHAASAVSFDAGRSVEQHNQRSVQDWWYGLEELPPIDQKAQQALYQTLLAAPFGLLEDHFERLERLFFAPAIGVLTRDQLIRLVDTLPLLLLDPQATENCIWLLSENAFVHTGQEAAQVQLWQHVDVLRCFMPLGAETLQVLASALSQHEQPEKSAFWGLLDLEALSRAAKLAVEQSPTSNGQGGDDASNQNVSVQKRMAAPSDVAMP